MITIVRLKRDTMTLSYSTIYVNTVRKHTIIRPLKLKPTHLKKPTYYGFSCEMELVLRFKSKRIMQYSYSYELLRDPEGLCSQCLNFRYLGPVSTHFESRHAPTKCRGENRESRREKDLLTPSALSNIDSVDRVESDGSCQFYL